MPHYRIYVTTTDGHVTAPATVIECDDDQEAIAKAERFINGRAVELWEGARFIVRFPASSWEGLAPVTPLDQLRLQLPDHDFDRLIQAAKPIAPPERDAFLKDIAAELGRYEVVGPGLLHRIISEVQRRYDIADQRRATR
jgi:hypothetical protein